MVGPAAHPPGPHQHHIPGLQRYLLAPGSVLEILRPDPIRSGQHVHAL
jgi:hypothetical protein